MHKPLNETRFIQVYCELTGAGEAQARSAYMYAAGADDLKEGPDPEETVLYRADPSWEEEIAYEPAAKSRSLSHVYQLPGPARERFA